MAANSLNNEKVKQLLRVASATEAAADQNVQTSEHNWLEPHSFSDDQLKMLNIFTKKNALTIEENLSSICHCEFNVTVDSISQHFAGDISKKMKGEQRDNYNLAFDSSAPTNSNLPKKSDQPWAYCGFVSIPPRTAALWVAQLLGGSKSDGDSQKPLSQLEVSLLFDIASSIVKAVSGSHRILNSRPAGAIIRAELPFETSPTEQLCKITLKIEIPESENSKEPLHADIFIFSELLERIVQSNPAFDSVQIKLSPADISKAVLERLMQMSFTLTAQLGSTELTFEEIMSLQNDDIVLIDRKVNEPINVIVEGKTLFRGKPVKYAGKHAVLINEIVDNKKSG
jgi:flagellar motor switch protein FliM